VQVLEIRVAIQQQTQDDLSNEAVGSGEEDLGLAKSLGDVDHGSGSRAKARGERHSAKKSAGSWRVMGASHPSENVIWPFALPNSRREVGSPGAKLTGDFRALARITRPFEPSRSLRFESRLLSRLLSRWILISTYSFYRSRFLHEARRQSVRITTHPLRHCSPYCQVGVSDSVGVAKRLESRLICLSRTSPHHAATTPASAKRRNTAQTRRGGDAAPPHSLRASSCSQSRSQSLLR